MDVAAVERLVGPVPTYLRQWIEESSLDEPEAAFKGLGAQSQERLALLYRDNLVVVDRQEFTIPWADVSDVRHELRSGRHAVIIVTASAQFVIYVEDQIAGTFVEALGAGVRMSSGRIITGTREGLVGPAANGQRGVGAQTLRQRARGRAVSVEALGGTVAIWGAVIIVLSVISGVGLMIYNVPSGSALDGNGIPSTGAAHPFLLGGIVVLVVGVMQGIMIMLLGRYAQMRALALQVELDPAA